MQIVNADSSWECPKKTGDKQLSNVMHRSSNNNCFENFDLKSNFMRIVYDDQDWMLSLLLHRLASRRKYPTAALINGNDSQYLSSNAKTKTFQFINCLCWWLIASSPSRPLGNINKLLHLRRVFANNSNERHCFAESITINW